jgi:hypothetical protein
MAVIGICRVSRRGEEEISVVENNLADLSQKGLPDLDLFILRGLYADSDATIFAIGNRHMHRNRSF